MTEEKELEEDQYTINLKSTEKRFFKKMNRTSTRITIDKNNRKQLALTMR